jgi:hypothetical protein
VNYFPRWLRATLAALLGVTALAGCTTYAQPDTALRGVSYTGGEWESKQFLRCVEPGANESVDNGGATYYYPITTRTFDFSARPGADAGPISVSTSNNQELSQGGTITFTLDTSCAPYTDRTGKVWPGGKLQMFHDTIGRSKGAFFGEESTVVPQGWRDAMNIYLGGPAERTMDNVGGGYTWQELYSDKNKTTAFVDEVKKEIPAQIAALTGGEQFYVITDIQLDKPNVSGALKAQLEASEASALAQQTAAAEQAFIASFPGGSAGYAAWQEQKSRQALRDAQARCYNEARCNAVPVGVDN